MATAVATAGEILWEDGTVPSISVTGDGVTTAFSLALDTDWLSEFNKAPGHLLCTSTSRPASPSEGMVIYETDTNTKRWYDGTNWQLFWLARTVEVTFTSGSGSVTFPFQFSTAPKVMVMPEQDTQNPFHYHVNATPTVSGFGVDQYRCTSSGVDTTDRGCILSYLAFLPTL